MVTLVLDAHVVFLGFLPLKKKLVDVNYVDEGPGEIVVIPDAIEPVGFGWESYGVMEVAHFFFNAGQFVDIIDCLGWVWVM